MDRKVSRTSRLSFDHGLFWPDPVPPEVERRRSSGAYRRGSAIPQQQQKRCKICRTNLNVVRVVKLSDNSLDFYCPFCAPRQSVVHIQEETPEDGTQQPSGLLKYRGFIFTIMSSICFSLTAVVVKYLKAYHPVNVALWRFQGSFLPAVPIMIYHRYCQRRPKEEEEEEEDEDEAEEKMSTVETVKAVIMLFLRSVFTCNALLLNFYALKYMEIGDALVILSSTPAFAYFFGFLFLGEPVGIVPIVMSLVTLSGVVFIIRPPMLTGGSAMDENTLIGSGLALGSTMLVTISYVLLRYSKAMHYSITTFCFGVWGTIENLVIALFLGVLALPANDMDWWLAAGLIILSFFGQIFIVLALQYEKTGPVTLFRTCDVVFGFMWQAIFWSIVPDLLSSIGAVIVVFGVVVIAIRKWIAALPEDDGMRKALWFLLK